MFLARAKEGKSIGCIKSLADDRNVETVIGQVEALAEDTDNSLCTRCC
jgi:hypothetical protein